MSDLEAKLKSSRTLRQYDLLADAVRIADAQRSESVMMEPLYGFGQDRWGVNENAIDQDITHLMQLDYLFFERSAVGIGDFHLKQAGRDAAEEFEALRLNPRKRAMVIPDLMLRWLYGEYLNGNESPVIDGFLKSPHGNFYGSPFTEAELTRASYRLLEDGYISGTGSHGGPVIRPSLRAKGIKVAEQDGSVSAPAASAVGNVHNYHVSVSNSQGINVAAGSSGATQSNTLTANQTDEAKKVAEAFRAMMPMFGLSSDQERQGMEVRDELEGEIIRPEPDSGRIKKLVGKAVEVAALGTTSGVVEAFIGLTEKFMETI
ncbi:hypothetical protein [Arthrobacter sp. KK5.5]|uniref:hypothetical protein n=1 Tax=Arthrobacter sp. KK5.5 TaxID=3373084 RepID=UPI003EE485BC